MPLMDYFKEKRGFVTLLGVIALLFFVYYIVRYGTSTLFQGNIGVEQEPPPVLFDVPGVEVEDENNEGEEDEIDPADISSPPPAPTVVGFGSNDDDDDDEDPADPPVNNPAEEDDDEDPADPPTDNNDNDPEIEIRIVDHDVSPKGFNPLVSQTKIEYEISTDAKVKITIRDEDGDTVVTLVNDEILEGGEYSVFWNGTDSTTSNGDVVEPGKYTYRIQAKNPTNSTVEDSETGNITAVYAVGQVDFEAIPPQTTQQTQTPTTNSVSTQNAATVAVQNATSGQTVGTGPGLAMYALLPFTGYLLSRRKKNDRK